MNPLHKRLLVAVLSLVALVLVGIIGYVVIEGWPPLQSIYMTIITLTTTGFTDFNVSPAGRIFTIVLLVGGAAVFTYSIGTATALLVEGELSDVWRRRRMEKEIAALRGHYIVCGAGNTGIHVIDELVKMREPFVVVECCRDRVEGLLEDRKFPYVLGDATQDSALKRAGIDHARGLVAALAEDADNLFVVLSARNLNPGLRIVSAAVGEGCPQKLRKAGADEVIQTDQIGGLRMASVLLRPHVVSFLDVMLRQEETVRFGETTLREGSELLGRTLDAARIQEQTGLVVLAVRRGGNGKFLYNPPPDTRLDLADSLIVIGDVRQVSELRRLARDAS